MTQPSVPKKRTTFYIEPNILHNFKKICSREEESMSEKVEKYMARYNAVHMKGNPQLLLETFVGKTKHTCFKCEGRFTWLYHVKFVSGLLAKVCQICFNDYNAKGLVKKVLGIIGKKR